MKIVNKIYNINGNIDKNIVLISDIHYNSNKDIKHLNKVLDNIKKINPDFICIPGDVIDNSNIIDYKLFNWLTKLSNIGKVILTLGNHEYYINRKDNIYGINEEYIKQLKNIENLYFLDNKNLVIDNINFIGLTLPISHYMVDGETIDSFNENIKNIKTKFGYYNILLCHSPVNLTKEEVISNLNIDLCLCGHMHGGVVPRFLRFIFKNNGLISPIKKLFPKDVYGNIKIGNKNIIITSGIKVLSESHFPIIGKFFSSEIVEIKIKQ